MNKDSKAYANGSKKLDPELYTTSYSTVPEEYNKLNLTITKVEDCFLATDGDKFKEEIVYNRDFAAYFITINMIVATYSFIV